MTAPTAKDTTEIACNETQFCTGAAEATRPESLGKDEGHAHRSAAGKNGSSPPDFSVNNHGDPYLRPAFTFGNRGRRALWALSYFLFFRPTPPPLFWWRSLMLRIFGAKIGPRNFIYPSARIWAPWLLETEAMVTIGREAEIYNPGRVILRHHSIVSQNAFLCGATHDYNDPAFPFQSRRIVLEAYSWICARAIVLPGVTIGEGAILGAGSVTARSLDPWWVYAGNPAQRAKPRNRRELV